MTSQAPMEVAVLVVGGGPTGLAASLLLSRHGVESLTVERHPGTSIYPRATGINVRSMEILRSLGLEDQVRSASFKAQPRIAFSRVLIDKDPQASPSFHAGELDFSPSEWTSCSQYELEPILLRAAASHREAKLLFGTELVGFESTGDMISAQVRDRATGALSDVRSRYMIAADGSRSPVRERLGLKMRGVGVLGHLVSIHFSAELVDHLPNGPTFLHFVQNEEASGMFISTDGRSRWVFAVRYDPDQGESSASFSADRAVELIRKGSGIADLEVEINGIVPWLMEADSAERWRVGNVFLAGDAAHRMTPAGGFGMNTGIQDVHNLCWKLAAVEQGWAGPGLLETYEVERYPVAQYNLDRSVGIVTGAPDANQRTGSDVDLGFTYTSASIYPDETEPVRRSDGDYEPGARPGSRAPHHWLGRGSGRVSTLDLLGSAFTLLSGQCDTTWCDAASAVARELDMPLIVRTVGCTRGSDVAGRTWTSLYGIEESGAVLIRPDGHVAWRQRGAVSSPGKELREVLRSILGRCDALPEPMQSGALKGGDA